ncbi:hypothetical protein GLOIN_2v1561294 [Rhizophagus clarus]|uniref:Uncharacterized protein n=1 Tax=Rhizophagus clarus TaxID=94130 RepID=A0A8H3MJQ6_9GLOM|nr:hypothetical protein GLOIN_2v1561294 [Rhizophagus clarus]
MFNDKKLVARQTEFICNLGFSKILRATGSDIEVTINSIFLKFAVECDMKTDVTIESAILEKSDTNGKFVTMTGVSKTMTNIGIPNIPGFINVGSYLLSADPSECLNAPNNGIGVLAKATVCVSATTPAGFKPTFSEPCQSTSNIVMDCPPNSSAGSPAKTPGESSSPPESPEVPEPPELPEPPNSPDSNSPNCNSTSTNSTLPFGNITSAITSFYIKHDIRQC